MNFFICHLLISFSLVDFNLWTLFQFICSWTLFEELYNVDGSLKLVILFGFCSYGSFGNNFFVEILEMEIKILGLR